MHDAHDNRSTPRHRLRGALLITGTFLVIEVIGGWWSGSLALLADAGHMFTDVAALLLAYAAMTLAQRGPTARYSFGLYRAEILAAFINAQVLLVIGLFLFVEAYDRWHTPVPVDADVMLGVALAGLFANLVAARYLHGHQHGSLNVQAAYLEVVTDAIGSVGVIVAALALRFWGWLWVDPAVSVAIACFIVPRAVSLLRRAGHVLLEGTPGHVDLPELRRRLAEVPGVAEIHDFHCWTLTSGVDSASVHVRLAAEVDRWQVRQAVEQEIREGVGVRHITVQIEAPHEVECCSIRQGTT